jgi:hypothetical protein
VLVIDLLRADEADELPDMVVGELHMPAAGHVIGPAAHRKVAEVLKPLLQ